MTRPSRGRVPRSRLCTGGAGERSSVPRARRSGRPPRPPTGEGGRTPVSRPSFGELAGQDPYDILELPSGASETEVRAARKRLLRRYHPDLPAGDLRRTQMIT